MKLHWERTFQTEYNCNCHYAQIPVAYGSGGYRILEFRENVYKLYISANFISWHLKSSFSTLALAQSGAERHFEVFLKEKSEDYDL